VLKSSGAAGDGRHAVCSGVGHAPYCALKIALQIAGRRAGQDSNMSRTLRGCVVLLLGTLQASSVVAQHTPSTAPSASSLWNELAAGNRRFISGKTERRDLPARRKQLVSTQNPHVAVLSCADSRVPPEVVSTRASAISSPFDRLERATTRCQSGALNMRSRTSARRWSS
jgi:hypothetical protein